MSRIRNHAAYNARLARDQDIRRNAQCSRLVSTIAPGGSLEIAGVRWAVTVRWDPSGFIAIASVPGVAEARGRVFLEDRSPMAPEVATEIEDDLRHAIGARIEQVLALAEFLRTQDR